MPGDIGALAAEMRETPALRTGALTCQLGGDECEDSNTSGESQVLHARSTTGGWL